MKYIIVDPDEQSGIDLKKILDEYEMLDFQGSFATLETAENRIRREPPDIAFIRVGKAELNAFQLSCVIRGINLYSKVIFYSSQKSYAVDAFECDAYGFLSMPFDEKKIKHLLMRSIEKRSLKRMKQLDWYNTIEEVKPL
jgi:two-component SAPR family response regulator